MTVEEIIEGLSQISCIDDGSGNSNRRVIQCAIEELYKRREGCVMFNMEKAKQMVLDLPMYEQIQCLHDNVARKAVLRILEECVEE